jgi:hypothetical protein
VVHGHSVFEWLEGGKFLIVRARFDHPEFPDSVSIIGDDQLDDEVDQVASRLARFDHDAIARTKSYVDQVTLPSESEFPPALADFFEVVGRPAQHA